MDNPKISVIMGIYNCEEILSQAIESVINQTYSEWELIMCDDGSKDNTYKIACDYAEKYENIHVLKNEKNMRLAYSLNRCLEVAKGKYIARMDADDLNLPERLEKQVEFLENHDEYELVSCRSMVFENGKDKGIRGKEGCPGKYSLLKTTPFMHPTIMMRKSAYDSLGGYLVAEKTIRGEDMELWFRFFEKNYTGYILNDILYKYHESKDDFKKRSLKAAYGHMQIMIEGYRRLQFPLWYYPFVLKPILAAVIPDGLMAKYKMKKLRRN